MLRSRLALVAVTALAGCRTNAAPHDAGAAPRALPRRDASTADVAARAADRRDAAAGPAAADEGPLELLPVPLTRGATLAGRSAARGSLGLGWVLPDRSRVHCGSRDRGASWRCRRLELPATAPPQASVVSLVSNTGPEWLWLVETPRRSWLAAPTDLTSPSYTLPGRITASLAMLVDEPALYATLEPQAGRRDGQTVRVTRGNAEALRGPAELARGAEAAMVRAGGQAWWLGVAGAPSGNTLMARRLTPTGAFEAATPRATLAPGTVLLERCEATARAWVLAIGTGAAGRLVGFGAAEATVASLESLGRDTQIVCDDRAAWVLSNERLVRCEADACAAAAVLPGPRRIARLGGQTYSVATREGRLVGGFGDGPLSPLRGVAREVRADEVWLFETDGRLTLFAIGELTTVWYSDDGVVWRGAREVYEPPAHISLDVGRVRR
ncbi:MAG: hypothetical protein JNK72_11745 [Myxococcales bacterium]|nr:hypothetical protein [Myxococcales bacterium]